MRRNGFSLEYVFYIAIFLLALFIRMAGIEQVPLADTEASLALQALALSRGEPTQVGPQPAYLAFTMAWMFLFGGGDWAARFWPAAAGSLLVLMPLFFRRWLGRLPALLMALFLALDPGLLMASLQANGLTIALLFVLLAVGLALEGRVALAGTAAGLALLGGPSLWPGILGLGLAFWLSFLRRSTPADDSGGLAARPLGTAVFEPEDWRRMIVFALATLFFAGTLFFAFPRGLSAMASSLPAYLRGWVEPSGVPVLLLVLALVLYEFLPLLLGLWGGIGSLLRKNPLDRFLLVWWGISTALVLLYPGRQGSDIVWSVIPLTGLAARQLVRMIDLPKYNRLPVFGQALLSALILGFISLTVLSVVNNPQFANSQEIWLRLAGAVIMLVASTGLIGWGWSKEVAIRGSTWGVLAVLVIYAISAAWNSSHLSSTSNREFWMVGRQLPEEPLLQETISDLSEWGPVISGGPELVVIDIESPALRWALRNHQQVSYVSHISPEASPALLITEDRPELALASTYRGQDFTLNESSNWNSLKPNDWVRWLAFRSVPAEAIMRDKVVLWARTDLFPGGDVEAQLESDSIEGSVDPE